MARLIFNYLEIISSYNEPQYKVILRFLFDLPGVFSASNRERVDELAFAAAAIGRPGTPDPDS